MVYLPGLRKINAISSLALAAQHKAVAYLDRLDSLQGAHLGTLTGVSCEPAGATLRCCELSLQEFTLASEFKRCCRGGAYASHSATPGLARDRLHNPGQG